MLFARVSKNEDDTYEVLEWPLTEEQLRARFAHTILPKNINAMVLAGTEYVAVPASTVEEDMPQQTKTHKLGPTGLEFVEGTGWVRTYALVEITDLDEASKRVTRKWASIRKHRDDLMAYHDWRVLRNQRETRLGLTVTEDIADIDAEMQKLANVTENYNDPYLIDWDNLV